MTREEPLRWEARYARDVIGGESDLSCGKDTCLPPQGQHTDGSRPCEQQESGGVPDESLTNRCVTNTRTPQKRWVLVSGASRQQLA